MHDLGIVIVNWNTRDYLHRCLKTVFASAGDFSCRVIVVDNGSSDGSAEMVAREFPQVTLISGHGNVGYPAGNNLGLRALGYADRAEDIAPDAPRYALLLNPDTELPPDALARMIAFMDAHPEVGAAGPKLVLPDGSLDLACRRSEPTIEVAFWRLIGFSRLFPRSRLFARYNLTFLDENETAEVDSVVGAFMMVRREAIADVGLLDEAFFMYGEDLDWSKRIKEAGWKIVYYPEVQVRHVKRAASRQSRRAQFEFVRAFLIFYNKHYRAQTGWLAHLAVLLGLALWGGPRLWPEVFTPSSLRE
ncbi:MAG TPA: glycosyltransferase [Chloroflexi bacterium]|nr:glycosyltransferase [Chloroflexota bacterium]